MSRLDVSDALGEAFRTVFHNLGTYFRTQGVLVLVVGLITLTYDLMVTNTLQPLLEQAVATQDFELLLAQLPAMIGGGLIVMGLSWVLNVLALGIGIVATHRLLHGEDTSFGQAFERVKPRLGNLLVTTLLITLAFLGVIVLGFVLFFLIVPVFAGIAVAIYLAVRWATALPVSVLEEHSASENLGRARDMSAGSRLPIFGAFVLLVLATMAIGIVVAIPTAMLQLATTGDVTDPATAMAVPVGVQVFSWALSLIVQFFSTFVSTALMVVIYKRLVEPVAQHEPPMGTIGGDDAGFGTSPPPGY